MQEILHTIDTDDSGTLDVMECLEVPDLYKTPTKFGNALHNKHTKVYKLSPSQLYWLHVSFFKIPPPNLLSHGDLHRSSIGSHKIESLIFLGP